MGFFRWLRQQVRAAVVGGVQDALEDVGAAEFTAPRLGLRLDALARQAAGENGHGGPVRKAAGK